MILGIGTDVLEIERIEKPLSNLRFGQRVYTQVEREYIERKGQSGAESAAGFFCAKEAGMKALGVGMLGAKFSEIEVGHLPTGAPTLHFHGGALERYQAMGGKRTHLTISHSHHLAVATVIIEGEDA